MDYVESLLEEYFDVSQTLQLGQEWLESLLAIEEEICWEFNVPTTNKFRDLFRLIPSGISKENYVATSIQILSREKARYYYKPNHTVYHQSKAA
ncbi:hypothetical protein EHQ92_14775 [Leptospira biflexa]|uniref:hypothetical protein n=1 Tax=Leptospira biflexa TaxID=172 RepID=UPI001091383F|nr:hypothetical protein [Leptospira biflexa]TGM43965.1 hypothetical protein EHQ92_14775 [Leptospira biflexa]TGM44901.1 hypothetical protein EHQ88_15360 [Leptospira biflexa]